LGGLPGDQYTGWINDRTMQVPVTNPNQNEHRDCTR
jgi:hypothetical protein